MEQIQGSRNKDVFFSASHVLKTLTSLFPPLGAWTIHIVLIIALKILFDIIPGVSQETSWTLTNITYMFGSYLMFHWVQGVPFEFNAGAYDNLNMWEQIDNGDQYTPAKKFLLIVPILLFLLSTHYTHYDFIYFMINFLAVLGVVIPKLPWVRIYSEILPFWADERERRENRMLIWIFPPESSFTGRVSVR